VLDNIDWDCEVKTLFRTKNLGCGKAVSGAITWFFEQVEQGIILEDDTLPSVSFFVYCAELLERYKDDERIYHIAGWNPLMNTTLLSRDSYYFARIMHCWGWASWRRAWRQYSFDLQGLADFIAAKKINKIFRGRVRTYWLNIFRQMEKHEIDTWDYQWTYTIFKNDGICLNPAKNLISNIGWGDNATHTISRDSVFGNYKTYEINDIKHPKKIKINNLVIMRINKRLGLMDTPWIIQKFYGFLGKLKSAIRTFWKKW
jgi:hypothetical protein